MSEYEAISSKFTGHTDTNRWIHTAPPSELLAFARGHHKLKHALIVRLFDNGAAPAFYRKEIELRRFILERSKGDKCVAGDIQIYLFHRPNN